MIFQGFSKPRPLITKPYLKEEWWALKE